MSEIEEVRIDWSAKPNCYCTASILTVASSLGCLPQVAISCLSTLAGLRHERLLQGLWDKVENTFKLWDQARGLQTRCLKQFLSQFAGNKLVMRPSCIVGATGKRMVHEMHGQHPNLFHIPETLK